MDPDLVVPFAWFVPLLIGTGFIFAAVVAETRNPRRQRPRGASRAVQDGSIEGVGDAYELNLWQN